VDGKVEQLARRPPVLAGHRHQRAGVVLDHACLPK
jgi:hypothetical protein